MARHYYTNIKEKKAIEYVLTIENLEEYKNAWLTLCNNAREYPDTIYNISNNSKSDIFVLMNPKNEYNEIWLEQFGTITNINKDTYAIVVEVECEYDNFDKDYIDSTCVLKEVY